MSINDIYANTIDICEIYEALHNSIPAIIYWVYMCSGKLFPEFARVREVPIDHVVKAENAVWSPQWGMKGVVDTICDVELNGIHYDIPFEFKTGKEDSISHGAQVTLYSLLLSQFNQNEDFILYTPSRLSGYLVYIKSPSDSPSEGYSETQYAEVKNELENGKRGPSIVQYLREIKNQAEAIVQGTGKNSHLQLKPQRLNTTHLRALLMRRNLIVSYHQRERRNRKKVIKAFEEGKGGVCDIEDLVVFGGVC